LAKDLNKTNQKHQNLIDFFVLVSSDLALILVIFVTLLAIFLFWPCATHYAGYPPVFERVQAYSALFCRIVLSNYF